MRHVMQYEEFCNEAYDNNDNDILEGLYNLMENIDYMDEYELDEVYETLSEVLYEETGELYEKNIAGVFNSLARRSNLKSRTDKDRSKAAGKELKKKENKKVINRIIDTMTRRGQKVKGAGSRRKIKKMIKKMGTLGSTLQPKNSKDIRNMNKGMKSSILRSNFSKMKNQNPDIAKEKLRKDRLRQVVLDAKRKKQREQRERRANAV